MIYRAPRARRRRVAGGPLTTALVLVALHGVSLQAHGVVTPPTAVQNSAWTTPIAPFHIAGDLYYVGSQDLASYLIATPQGAILINSNLQSSVPLIRHSVEQLGFHFKDIKIL